MRREDIQPLLYQASDLLPEPDLADSAWVGGLAARRRRRRSVVIGLVAGLVVAVVAAVGVGVNGTRSSELVPPPTTPTQPRDYVPAAGQIAGIDYWVAPPAGSEPFLDRLHTPLGDRLRPPEDAEPLAESPIDHLAAVVLQEHSGRYDALLLGADSRWARADLELLPIRTGSPLSSGAISPDGRFVAFPQPGALVTVDVTTAEVFRVALPSQDVSSVSWLSNGERILVSGPNVAYRVLVGEGRYDEQPVTPVSASRNPASITAPYRIDSGAVLRYMINGQYTVDSELRLPVRTWVGQTFSTYTMAARLFVADDLQQVPTKSSQPQVVAAISTLRALPSALLVLAETEPSTPGTADPAHVREPGCCAVLGWYDDYKPLIQVQGWILAWDVRSGKVQRVTELDVDGVAFGPGLRP
ncbi:TolB-like translocation protein [Kribbella swartbergensis]